MRIIAGRFRSRKLKTVPGMEVRPTPDRLRETLFSILAARIEGKMFLDAYAGSGAVGIEALSRGAKHVILLERNAHAVGVIRDNLKALGVEEEITVVRGNAVNLLRDQRADIAFIDPPYDSVKDYQGSLFALAGTECPLVIAQHSSRLKLEDAYGELRRTRIVKQGDNALSFFQRPE